MTATAAMTLSNLEPGQSAVIDSFLSKDQSLRRIRELGLLKGTPLKVVRRAPLGDPIEISVHGSLLSIRKEHADLIAVDPEVTGS